MRLKKRSASVWRRLPAVLIVLAVCLSLCACSFGFSLESILQTIKSYITGDETEPRPADFIGESKNDTFEYDLYETYAVITKYTGAATYVTVPSELEGKPVRKIGSLAFYYGTKIVYLHLPESVTELEDNALYYCDALTTLELPSSLKTLGEKCFSWCSALTVIALPSGVKELPNFCFNECTSLKDLFLPEGLTSVGNRAFSGCRSLESLSFGETMTSVGMYAFQGATSLKEVTLPGACSLADHAFEGAPADLIVHTPEDSNCDRMCRTQNVRTDSHAGGEVDIVESSAE